MLQRDNETKNREKITLNDKFHGDGTLLKTISKTIVRLIKCSLTEGTAETF